MIGGGVGASPRVTLTVKGEGRSRVHSLCILLSTTQGSRVLPCAHVPCTHVQEEGASSIEYLALGLCYFLRHSAIEIVSKCLLSCIACGTYRRYRKLPIKKLIIIRTARIPIIKLETSTRVVADISLGDGSGPKAARYIAQQVRRHNLLPHCPANVWWCVGVGGVGEAATNDATQGLWLTSASETAAGPKQPGTSHSR
jgi:hypothetical protein